MSKLNTQVQRQIGAAIYHVTPHIGLLYIYYLTQILCPSYHDFWESPDGAPDVDDGGEEAGDEEHDGESSPGLSSAHLHLAGVDNDPVPVHGDGHHQQ